MLVIVLEFRLGKGRLRGRRPVHGLVGAVDQTLLHHSKKDIELLDLVVSVHGLVRVVPVSHDAVGQKVLLLSLDCGGSSGLRDITDVDTGVLLIVQVIF